MYGDGTQVRDWLYVDDHVRALLKVLEQGVVGDTYNIGGHNEQRNIDVVRMICKLLADEIPENANAMRLDQLITFVKDRPGHDTRYAIDAAKIGDTLRWMPEETFESGLRKTVRWYLSNRTWWGRVLDGSYCLQRIGKGR